MSEDFWDQFDGTDGDFPDKFKFEKVGDKISGTVTNVRVTDFGGTADPTPELWIDTDDGPRSVVASQTRLRRALAEKRPRKGDRIGIVYTGDGQSRKAGFSPPKLFDVVVKAANDDGATGDETATAGVVSANDIV